MKLWKNMWWYPITAAIIATGTFGYFAQEFNKSKNTENYCTRAKVEGYYMTAAQDNGGRILYIADKERSALSDPHVVAEDNNLDGRFDSIELFNVPRGSPMERFLNLNEAQFLFQKVREVGRPE